MAKQGCPVPTVVPGARTSTLVWLRVKLHCLPRKMSLPPLWVSASSTIENPIQPRHPRSHLKVYANRIPSSFHHHPNCRMLDVGCSHMEPLGWSRPLTHCTSWDLRLYHSWFSLLIGKWEQTQPAHRVIGRIQGGNTHTRAHS